MYHKHEDDKQVTRKGNNTFHKLHFFEKVTLLIELTSLGYGAVFSPPDEKRAQSKLPVTQAQKLGYAYG